MAVQKSYSQASSGNSNFRYYAKPANVVPSFFTVMKLLLTIIILYSFLVDNPLSKKETLLSITKNYLSDNYIVLKNYDEATINMLAEGDSLQEYVLALPTIIHEGFHVFGYTINTHSDTLRHYRLDDSTTIGVRKFNSFPARTLNEFVPTATQDKIFRYNTYINSNDTNNGTQKEGFLGLLEEYAAYYQSLKAYTSTYYFKRHICLDKAENLD